MPRPTEPGFPRGGAVAWRLAAPVVGGACRLWFPFRRHGPELPAGPVVVAANHFSHLDPVVVGASARRPVRYLAVDELYGRSRLFDVFTTWLGAIPMTRTRVPLGALRLALRELAAGGTIGLFPEGVRVWTWGERSAKRGAAWLAHRAGVPLVPFAVSGTDLAFGRGAHRITRTGIDVDVCEAISPTDFEDDPDPVGAMTREWEARIGRALRERM